MSAEEIMRLVSLYGAKSFGEGWAALGGDGHDYAKYGKECCALFDQIRAEILKLEEPNTQKGDEL